MEIIIPNYSISVYIVVLSTLNVASDIHVVLIVVCLSTYS